MVRYPVIAAWLAFTIVLGWLYAWQPPSPDQAIFDYIGWIAVQGGSYYVDVVEQNWPAKMVLHTISTWLFGNHIWSWRLFDYLWLLGGCTAMFGLLRRSGLGTAAWLVVPIYQWMYTVSNPWLSGQRDIVAAHTLLVAGWAFVERRQGAGRWTWLVISGALVFTFLMRPTYGLFPVLLIGIDLATRKQSGRSVKDISTDAIGVVGIMAALTGLVVGLMIAAGMWHDWLEQAYYFNTECYGHDREQAASIAVPIKQLLISEWHWATALGVFGLGLMARRQEVRPGLAVLLSVLVTGVVSAYVQNKGFGYHLGAMVPVQAGLLAGFFGEMLRWYSSTRQPQSTRRPAPGLALAITLVLAVAGLSKKTVAQYRPQIAWALGRTDQMGMWAQLPRSSASTKQVMQLVDYVKTHTTPEEPVLVWDREVLINELSERKTPSRFITATMLQVAAPPFRAAQAWHDEFRRSFAAHPPAFVVTNCAVMKDGGPLMPLEGGTPSALYVRERLEQDYVEVRSFGCLTLLERKDRRPPPSEAPSPD